MQLPIRPTNPRIRGVCIETPGVPGGGSYKIALREAAKRLPAYHLRVEIEPPVEGRTDTGIPIPVNTLGRWLWGVPGYAGVAVFDGFADPPRVYIPSAAPDAAIELIRAAAGLVQSAES